MTNDLDRKVAELLTKQGGDLIAWEGSHGVPYRNCSDDMCGGITDSCEPCPRWISHEAFTPKSFTTSPGAADIIETYLLRHGYTLTYHPDRVVLCSPYESWFEEKDGVRFQVERKAKCFREDYEELLGENRHMHNDRRRRALCRAFIAAMGGEK